MFFRAPSFTYLGDTEKFQALEKELWTVLDLQANSVYLSDIKFNEKDYLIVRVSLFNPDGTMFFNRSQIADISFKLSNQTFKPPDAFGTFYFIPSQYTFPGISISIYIHSSIHLFVNLLLTTVNSY